MRVGGVVFWRLVVFANASVRGLFTLVGWMFAVEWSALSSKELKVM